MKRTNLKKIAFLNYIDSLFLRKLGRYLYDNTIGDIRLSEDGSVFVYCSRGFIPQTFLEVAFSAKECTYFVQYDESVNHCVLVFVSNYSL